MRDEEKIEKKLKELEKEIEKAESFDWDKACKY